MGNNCCQVDLNTSALADQFLKVEEFHETTLPEDDSEISSWISENRIHVLMQIWLSPQ